MIQWEYSVVYPTGGWGNKWEGEKITLEEFLNKKGRDGWQLVHGPTSGHTYCIFKRQK